MYHQPLVVPAEDQQRMYEAWRLRQLLEGTWRPLLAEHGHKQLGALRATLVGEWDTSANLLSSVIDQTSTMYDVPPEAKGDEVLRDSFQRGGWWGMARQHQRYVRGMHESLVFVGWDSTMGCPTFEIVTADQVFIEGALDNPARPVTVWRMRQRPIRGQGRVWFWDRWSIEGGVGSFSVWSADRLREVTTAFLDPAMWSGPAYPYRDELGAPILPCAIYHAAGCGRGIWHPHQHQEVVFGTLQVGVLWTAMVHGFLRASWDQRWIANGRVRGGATQRTETGQSVRLLTPDPTAILELEGKDSGSATAGAWGASIDIEAAEQTVRRYENRLAVHFGLSPSDLVIESLNPASGASITVSQAGKRQIALRDLVHFALGDRALAEVVASVNRAWGRPCTAQGFRLRYQGIALTAAERESVNRWLANEMDRGLLDRVSAYQELHPGTTTEDAIADLEVLDMRKAVAEKRAQMAASLSGQSVADTALNGAQIAEVRGTVVAVALGELPRDAAIAILQRALGASPEEAARLLGSAGQGFVPSAPRGPPSPFAAPPAPVPAVA
jgi:hypothetical protein